jgi:MoxR-like ATPase
MFKILVDYPAFGEEYRITETTTRSDAPPVRAVLEAGEIGFFQKLVKAVPVPPHVIVYAMRLVRATRVPAADAPDFVRGWVSWGAGPRAVQFLVLGAKARAAFDGRHFATVADVKAAAHPVLRHRILTNFAAESEGIRSDQIVDRLLATVADDEAANALPADVREAFRS